MKIGELARLSGLSGYAIRYYEQIGLLPRASRDRAGRRDYDHDILQWIEFLGRLKATGMPTREMLAYARLRAAGDATIAERRALLDAHRAAVRRRVDALQACLAALDAKIVGYDARLEEERHEQRAEKRKRKT